MKKNMMKKLVGSMLFFLVCLVAVGPGLAAEYSSLDGLKDVKVVFDVRGTEVKTMALRLDLIHQTYYDAAVRNVSKKPAMAVVFGGGAVNLISSEYDAFDDEEKMLHGLIADKLLQMAREGIRLEVCLFAADVHDVDPATFPKQINRVDNGWISVIGYQAQGYSLISLF